MESLRNLTDHYNEKTPPNHAQINFLSCTDQHSRLNHGFFLREGHTGHLYELAANHITSIWYILHRCPGISFVVSGSDIGNSCDHSHDPAAIRASHEEIMAAPYSLIVPAHCLVGKHDDAIGMPSDRGAYNVPFVLLPKEMALPVHEKQPDFRKLSLL